MLNEVGWFHPELPNVDDYELWLRIARRYPIGHLQTIPGFWPPARSDAVETALRRCGQAR